MTNADDTTRSRSHARRVALLLLARAFPGRLALIVALVLVTGALPAIFAALVARVVTTLPAAARGGFASPDGRRIVGTLMAVGAVLLVQEIVAATRGVAVTDLYRRYDEYLLTRVMQTTLSTPGLELFEDPALAAKTDQAARIARFGPGELVSGLAGKWSVQAQGLASTLLVVTVWPVAAVALAAVWLVVGRRLQVDYFRANPFWADPLRRARYVKQVALQPAWAKEVRVFGLTDWLGDRFGRQWTLVMAELWRRRRIDQRSMAALVY